eukprot:1127157-Pyramimonas_sp.AAC.1
MDTATLGDGEITRAKRPRSRNMRLQMQPVAPCFTGFEWTPAALGGFVRARHPVRSAGSNKELGCRTLPDQGASWILQHWAV